MEITDASLPQLMDLLHGEMKKHANPEKAVNMANYLKNQFDCYGIKTPVRNEIQKEWFKKVKLANLNHWDITYNLWSQDQREYQYIAIDLLKKTPAKLIQIEDDKLLEEIITTKSWWDSVDLIASNYVGKYFLKFPEQIEPVIGRWRKSDNMWLNRTCLIFQLKYKEKLDVELLTSLIDEMKLNQEFFIQKAIGWSLRQHSKYDPDSVREYLKTSGLKGLALREASKYI
ncbi:MAG: DNA alkylation repair protein [Crocinitomicaceae bacterium]|nr:DNA alkylation repair protein [Crocinitomicaceae bacterium]